MTPLPDTTSSTVVRSLFAEAFPDLPIGRPKLLLAGQEHDTWRVGDVVVKFPKRADHAAKLERERSRQHVCGGFGHRVEAVGPQRGTIG